MKAAAPPRESGAHPTSAYVRIGDDRYASSELTRGPWHPAHQHGGPPIALAARCIERAAAVHGLTHVARLTANLLRPVPLAPLAVSVSTDYLGRNVAHLSARIEAGEKEVARFTAVAQRESDMPLPEGLPGHPLPGAPRALEASPAASFRFAAKGTGYHDLIEGRVARGDAFRGPAAVWFRLRHPLLADEATSGLSRVAVVADSGNGISAILDFHRYTFVNSDLTLNLLRRARGEWICVDACTLLGDAGCGLAEARIFDSSGLIGRSTQSLIIRPRD